MDDRVPSYKLATESGDKPYADGDRAQAQALEELHLYETCQRDPSTIVVDVGAFLGDFGLYAAACGCTVYTFEIQPKMVALIRLSIKYNSFPPSRFHLYHNAVSDLPTGSAVTFTPGGGSTAIVNGSMSVETIRLDDVPWSSSSIYMLKVDVEGLELNVLRSAKNLFVQRRIHHVIFEYSPWLSDRAPQKLLLPYVENELKAKFLYALHRKKKIIFGPLTQKELQRFYQRHLVSHLQTDIYAVFDENATNTSIRATPYRKGLQSA
ncbi:unnamed protein product [Adineta ricciae]|uniref:Methyltransferase FkbM domain-containing protein n=1 Tax=Adineta ricciae TaxID=249248 RepID=A0A813PS54_ADIRI|nr:unnamed protein product [Adineta ricciae]